MEFSRRGLMAVLLICFMVGMTVERFLGLTEPVSKAVVPFAQSVGGPVLWMVAGVLVGAFGLTFFRRWRGEEPGETGSRRRSGRF